MWRNALAIVAGLATFGSGPVSAKPSVVEVTIAHFTFMPANMMAAEGDVIVFTNNDIVAHTATATDGSWTTREIAPGRSARVKLPPKAGVDFFCRLHPVMKGHLTIISPPDPPARGGSGHLN